MDIFIPFLYFCSACPRLGVILCWNAENVYCGKFDGEFMRECTKYCLALASVGLRVGFQGTLRVYLRRNNMANQFVLLNK